MSTEFRPPEEALRLWIRAVYRHVGKWEAVGLVAARVLGIEYARPAETARSWADDGQAEGRRFRGSIAPGNVVVALMMAVPEVPLADYVFAPRDVPIEVHLHSLGRPEGGPQAPSANGAIIEALVAEKLAEMGRRLDEVEFLVEALTALMAEVGPDRLGVDYLDRLRRARGTKTGGNAEVERFIAELRGEVPPPAAPDPAAAAED